MTALYRLRAFNQDIGSWDISSLTEASLMFKSSAMTVDNMDNILRVKCVSVMTALYRLAAVKNIVINSPVIGVY
jgi:hypothetical protein